jgi:spore coat protein E
MLKEIVTKAVVSKGKIVDNKEITFDVVDNINKVIGCWIINHNYLSVVDGQKVFASGCYDVHIWYAINNSGDTKILKNTVEYRDEFIMENNKFDYENSDYKIYCIDYPTCTNLTLTDNKITASVKKSLAVDVIGESKLLVQVSDSYYKEDENMGINTNYMGK